MKYITTLLITAAALTPAMSAQTSIVGSRAIAVNPAATTGLAAVYVVENTASASLQYRLASDRPVEVQRYSTLGGGYAEACPYTIDGNNVLIPLGADDMGYIITESGNAPYCVWIVNYALHQWQVSAISVAESDCDRISLHVDNPAGPIAFYTVNGRREELDRDISLSYYTMTYNEDSQSFVTDATAQHYTSLHETISAPAPLCDTQFTLSPDRFAREWDLGHELTTTTWHTTAIDVRTVAEQDKRDADNEQPVEAELGGSAPCDITFKAAVTEAAVFHRWEISTDAAFDQVVYTNDQLEFSYTFTEAGTQYVRLTANNSDGTCEQLSDTYTISIGESRLECPNAFSPGTSEGTNDEWKVSYRSIISFDCHIFNRWGHELAHLTDPSQGWDGMVGGKVVPSGVYFYVIKARGSDGKDYNLAGDINVINSRRESRGTVTE